MAADPGLDRIAASLEDALLHASPAARKYFGTATDRFIAEHLRVFDGDPAELGALFLNLYRDLRDLTDPRSAGRPVPALAPEQILTGFQFHLAHGGMQLYLHRHPAAKPR